MPRIGGRRILKGGQKGDHFRHRFLHRFWSDFWLILGPILDLFLVIFARFRDTFLGIVFYGFLSDFWSVLGTPRHPKITFLVGTCRKNQGFPGFEKCVFLQRLTSYFWTFLGPFWHLFSMLFGDRFFNAFLIAFLIDLGIQNGPKTDPEITQNARRARNAPRTLPGPPWSSFWTHFGSILGSFWDHFGHHFASFWGHFC